MCDFDDPNIFNGWETFDFWRMFLCDFSLVYTSNDFSSTRRVSHPPRLPPRSPPFSISSDQTECVCVLCVRRTGLATTADRTAKRTEPFKVWRFYLILCTKIRRWNDEHTIRDLMKDLTTYVPESVINQNDVGVSCVVSLVLWCGWRIRGWVAHIFTMEYVFAYRTNY